MNNIVRINNHELQVKEYQGQRVVTFKDIDECHERPEGTARRNFNKNKEHFIEGVDYFKISPNEFRTTIGGMDKRQQNDVTLINESGYMMLVKSFTDNLAWEVQRMLVNAYFQKQPSSGSDDIDKRLIAQAKFMNAKARIASIWMKLADRVPQNIEYQQICNSYASEVLTGEKVLPLPKRDEHYFTATEVGEMFKISANKVGILANRNNLKTNENGKWFFDKSKYSNKEVETFKYNENGIKAIRLLLEGETSK